LCFDEHLAVAPQPAGASIPCPRGNDGAAEHQDCDDAIMLLAPKRAGDQQLQAALRPLLGKIDIATMREANLRANGNDSSSSPDAVARRLWDRIGKRQAVNP
jgi:hypothetical protein